MESNHLPSGYEPPALTDELRPQTYSIIAYSSLLGYNKACKTMQKINIRRIYYIVRHQYLTVNNGVILLAFLIALSWVWGSLGVMQRNYDLQKQLDYKKRELQLAQLETANLQLQGRYYQTREYQELAVRQDLGLALPGESVLILPPNSQSAKNADKAIDVATLPPVEKVGNFTQWMNLLFGENSKNANL